MTSPTPSSTPQSRFFINRNFAWLWGGQSISSLGDYIFNATLIFWIATEIAHNQSWAPLAVSGVLLAETLPNLVIGPFAGVFVDRWNKRLTMLFMDASRTVLNLLLLLATGSFILPIVPGGHLTVIQQFIIIYTIVFMMGACTQFFNPSSVAILGDIVAEKDWARATGRQQATNGLATITGLSLAGPLFFGLGVQWALLINALSFLISFFTILPMRMPPSIGRAQLPTQQSFAQEFIAGLRFYQHNRSLITITISAVLFLLAAGAINSLNIFFSSQNLHVSPLLFGYLNAALGAGAVIGAVLAAMWAQPLGIARTFSISLLTAGGLILIYARLTAYIPAVVVFFLLGFPNAAVNVALEPLLLAVTPREFIGRAVAVLMPAVRLASLVALGICGYLDSTILRNFHALFLGIHVGAVDLIFTVAGLLAIAAGLYAMGSLRISKPSIEAE